MRRRLYLSVKHRIMAAQFLLIASTIIAGQIAWLFFPDNVRHLAVLSFLSAFTGVLGSAMTLRKRVRLAEAFPGLSRQDHRKLARKATVTRVRLRYAILVTFSFLAPLTSILSAPKIGHMGALGLGFLVGVTLSYVYVMGQWHKEWRELQEHLEDRQDRAYDWSERR